MSAVVISILLLSITVGLGFSGFFGRFNILDSESKERSLALAEACGDTAIVNIAMDPDYDPDDDLVAVDSDFCTIISVSPFVGIEKTIKTQACVNKSTTNLEIKINKTFGVTSWKELANFSPNHPCS